jgi:hypothetical protein
MYPEHWHKVLLAAASDYFAAMFTGSMVEAEMETVELQGLEFSALQLLVDYCYSGENEKIFKSSTNVLKIIRVRNYVSSRPFPLAGLGLIPSSPSPNDGFCRSPFHFWEGDSPT